MIQYNCIKIRCISVGTYFYVYKIVRKGEKHMKKGFSIFLTLCIVITGLTGFTFSVSAAPELIDGHYVITSAEEFVEIASSINTDTSNSPYQTAELWITQNIALPSDYKPIGASTSNAAFKGKLLGMDETGQPKDIIITVSISSNESYVGLFGNLNNATIKNIVVEGSITATKTGNANTTAGGLAGSMSSGTLENCVNRASVTGVNNVGGLVGKSSKATITNCINTGTITGSNGNIAGISGNSMTDSIISCTNNGLVVGKGGNNVAGIAGIATGNIEKCINNAAVSSTANNVGGISGYQNGGAVKLSQNNAAVTGADNVGGVSGALYYTVETSFNTGTVTAGDAKYGGGIAGWNRGTIRNSFNAGPVTAAGTGAYLGGIAGKSAHSSNSYNIVYESCYNVGGVDTSVTESYNFYALSQAGGYTVSSVRKNNYFWKDRDTGKTVNDGELTLPSDFEIPSAKTKTEFADISALGFDTTVWDGAIVNELYPFPTIQGNPYPYDSMIVPFGQGAGTAFDPYRIYNDEEFDKIRRAPSACYELQNDITLSSSYVPFEFSGSLTGKDGSAPAAITMAIERGGEDYVGLFSKITGDVIIRDIKLAGSVTGNAKVGALAGYAYSMTAKAALQNIVNEASVTGSGNEIGGFIGRLYDKNDSAVLCSGLINKGTVTGSVGGVGGITGTLQISLTNSANLGKVTAVSGAAGGLVCTNYGDITNSYNSGDVSAVWVAAGITALGRYHYKTIESCYNTGTISGSKNSAGIVGLATGTSAGGSTVNNCYNIGKINSSFTANPICGAEEIDTDASKFIFSNCYYLSAEEAHDDGKDGTTPKNRENLAAASLGDAFAMNAAGGVEGYQFPQISGNPQLIAQKIFSVIFTAGGNGSVSPAGLSYVKGGETFVGNITADEGYQIDKILWNTVEQINQNEISYPITADSEISATFSEIPAIAPDLTANATPVFVSEDKTQSITFGTIQYQGYTIIEYGIAYSDTNTENKDEWKRLAAKTVLSENGQYGVKLMGDLLSQKTIYACPYVVYQDKNGISYTNYGIVNPVIR